MKKILSVILCMAVILSSMCATFAANEAVAWDGTIATAFAGGEGTSESPYQISNAAELAYFASMVNNPTSDIKTDVLGKEIALTAGGTGIKNAPYIPHDNVYTGVYFVLTSDIDLGDKEWTSIGGNTHRFNGSFDGQGHIIKNIKMTNATDEKVGLFGYTASDATIKNLGIENADYSFGDPQALGAGILAGAIGGGTIENCFVRNSRIENRHAQTDCVGGLVGTVRSAQFGIKPTATIKNCYVNGITFSIAIGEITASAFLGNTHKSVTGADIPDNAYYDASTKMTSAIWSNDSWSQPTVNVENCYVGNTSVATYGTGTFSTFYAFAKDKIDTATFTNCYTTAETPRKYDAETVNEGATLAAIQEALVKDGSAYKAGVSSLNDGYPLLNWESVETPVMTIEEIVISEGKVTGVTLKNYVSVEDDNLIVAIFESGVLKSVTKQAITDEKASTETQTITLSDELTLPSGGYTVRAFVLNDNLVPLCEAK